MNDDIVARLRAGHRTQFNNNEAADEIERLRAENERLIEIDTANEREIDRLLAELNSYTRLLPPPDVWSEPLLERMQRMAADAAKWRTAVQQSELLAAPPDDTTKGDLR